jgi:integrase
MARQQLPPQIKKIDVTDRSTSKTVVRYQVTADGGHDAVSGKRRQVRRRFTTEAAARAELATMQAGVAAGTYIHASKLTVDQVPTD